MKIKNFIFGVFAFIAMIDSVSALNICAKTGTYVAVLKINVNGDSYQTNNDQKHWRVDYNYKTLTGLAACNEIPGTYATATTNLSTSSADSGQHCWCKMEPVSEYGYDTGLASYWVYLNEYDDADSCATGCTNGCALAMKDNSVFRSGIFNSLW